jgi:hypothetical protein
MKEVRMALDSNVPAEAAGDGKRAQDPEADFNARFYAALEPSTQHMDLPGKLHDIYLKTVDYAIRVCGHKWDHDSKADHFALERVADIAMLAKYEAGEGKVTPEMLLRAADKVIAYWRPRCNYRTVFCAGYPPVTSMPDANGRTRLLPPPECKGSVG